MGAMAQHLPQVEILNADMEEKANQLERIVLEWKGKGNVLSMNLVKAENKTHNVSSEPLRVNNVNNRSTRT